MASSVKLDVDYNNVPSLYKKRKSPNFKDVLRERCHNRIKASRQALLDKFRSQNEVKGMFCDIIHEEVQVLQNGSNTPMDDLHSDSIENMATPLEYFDDRWLLEEYEKVLAEEEAHFLEEWQNQVICPVCEKSALSQCSTSQPRSPLVISCPSCRTEFPPVDSLRSLSEIIDTSLSEHDSRCDQGLFFIVTSNPDPCLYTICDMCSQYNRVL